MELRKAREILDDYAKTTKASCPRNYMAIEQINGVIFDCVQPKILGDIFTLVAFAHSVQSNCPIKTQIIGLCDSFDKIINYVDLRLMEYHVFGATIPIIKRIFKPNDFGAMLIYDEQTDTCSLFYP